MSTFGGLLEDFGFALDPAPEVHQRLNDEYHRLGGFIAADSDTRFRASAAIYPQGSKALGTVVRPLRDEDELDLDAVYRRDIHKESTTQARLKQTTGEQLEAFVGIRRAEGVAVELEDNRRCWTLRYPGFHIDILPALPDGSEEAALVGGEPILITDAKLRDWQASNPKGFIEWFRTTMRRPFVARRDAMAKSGGVEVKSIEDDTIKTPLQVAVQILKRHRDIYFRDQQSERPISVIITTLAGRAYQDELDPHAAVESIISAAPRLIVKDEQGRWVVGNPTDSAENFADKWNEDVRKPEAFFAWLQRVASDLAVARAQTGIDKVAKSLGGVLGDDAAARAVRRWNNRVHEQRVNGGLRATAGAATLGTTGQVSVPRHTFYGSTDDEV